MSIQIYGADGKPKAEEPKRPASCVVPHCWHLEEFQHTVPNHSDWRCCLCGTKHCVRALGPERPFEHGPHAGPSHAKGCGVVLGRWPLP